MSYEHELEEILKSIKENGELPPREPTEIPPVAPPRPHVVPTEATPEAPKEATPQAAPVVPTPEPQPPKKKERSLPDTAAIKETLQSLPEKLKGLKTLPNTIKEKVGGNEKLKVSFKVPEPVKNAWDKVFAWLKTLPLKKIGIGVGAVVMALVLVLTAIKLVDVGKTAYVHKYEKKYHVSYPEGLQKEFYDSFGKNPALAGQIIISDTNTDKLVYTKDVSGQARLKRGSSVYREQEVRSIALDKSYADLESVYKTPDGFKNASQKVTFKTLFNDETYRVVSAFYTNTKAEDDDGYIFPYCTYGNLTEKSFKGFEDRIKSRRLYDTGFPLLYEHRILTLSVDTDFMPDYKFVVVCVKTNNTFRKSKTAAPNEMIHYPQNWYTKNKKDNPYFLAGKWYPEIITNDETEATKKLTMQDFDFN